MFISSRILFLIPLLASLFLTSCTKKSHPTAPPDNGNGVPQGAARISGNVHDANGAALTDVALHAVYDFSGPAGSPADPQTPSSVTFYDDDQVLYTECNGSTPVPDGVMVEIFWDRNSNGPDSTDPQPPLCYDPPDCPNQDPPFTVNLIEFPINGTNPDVGYGPGLFYMLRNFSENGDVLTPNKFYGRIYCADGHVLYTSNPIDLPQGASEQRMHFTCTPCTGAPGIPAWRLDQAYPNPATDSVTVGFGLRESAQTLITLIWPGGATADSVLNASLGSGSRTFTFRLGMRPNGLYALRLRAGTFQADASLLKNVSDQNVLRVSDAATRTGNDGKYTFDTAAGQTIHKRSPRDEDQGTTVLARLRVIAIKAGYQVADTAFAVVNQQSYNVDLVLRPQ